jgi:uncharacterized protein YbjQ (UPF0145 family)
MFNKGDRVKVVSCEKGVSEVFINEIGIIDQVKPKEYYKYHINFRNRSINIEGEYFWWADENLEIFSGDAEDYDDSNEIDNYKKVILTTTNNIDGYKVKKYIDVVGYEYVIGTGIFSEFTTGIQDIFGERSSAFEEKMNAAKEFALDKIRQKAYFQEGDAVIGLDIDYTTFDANRIALVVNGTIVKLQPIDKITEN